MPVGVEQLWEGPRGGCCQIGSCDWPRRRDPQSFAANQVWERLPLRGTSLTELCQSESHIPETTIRWRVHSVLPRAKSLEDLFPRVCSLFSSWFRKCYHIVDICTTPLLTSFHSNHTSPLQAIKSFPFRLLFPFQQPGPAQRPPPFSAHGRPRRRRNVVLGVGKAEGSMDAANLLKPMLARGQVRCIGATTVDEYRKYADKERVERRFQQE